MTKGPARLLRALTAVCVGSAAPLVAQSAQIDPAPTFTKDVLPILQRSCQNCHRPGQVGPFSLMTYEDARPWARSIRMNVVGRHMPPWHLDRSIGEYAPDPSLSDDEVNLIARWVDGGALRGEPADAPPPREFHLDSTWVFGEQPDLIVTAPEVFIPADGADTYPEVEAAAGLAEDRYIKWMQVVPEHPKAMHHTMVYVIQSAPSGGAILGDAGGSTVARALGDGTQEQLLIMFAGGGLSGVSFPEGQAKLLQAGATIRFSDHFHPIGEEFTERTRIAFKFFPRGYNPKQLISTRAIGNRDRLIIPPGDSNARSDGYFTLLQPARVVSFLPHMHFRGKRMMLEAITPGGQATVLTDVNRFDWRWQISYRYKTPPVFPRGTVLHVTAYHDNSAANDENPDPSAFVTYGSRSIDEMGNGWVDFYYISDEEYAALARGDDAQQ